MGSVSDANLLHIVIYMAYMFCILTLSYHGQACEQIIDAMVYYCYSYKCSQNIKYVTYVLQIWYLIMLYPGMNIHSAVQKF